MGYSSSIKSFRMSVLCEDEVQKVLTEIQSVRFEPTRATHRRHIEQLKTRSDHCCSTAFKMLNT